LSETSEVSKRRARVQHLLSRDRAAIRRNAAGTAGDTRVVVQAREQLRGVLPISLGEYNGPAACASSESARASQKKRFRKATFHSVGAARPASAPWMPIERGVRRTGPRRIVAARAGQRAIARQHRIEEQVAAEIDLVRREAVAVRWQRGARAAEAAFAG
jgi:hypothetical protein